MECTSANSSHINLCMHIQLPYICPYQTGRYHVLLYGPEVPAPIVEETEYTTANTIDPLTFNVDSTALAVNNTYTVVVFVSNSEGTTNASVIFSQSNITFDFLRSLGIHPPPHCPQSPVRLPTPSLYLNLL